MNGKWNNAHFLCSSSSVWNWQMFCSNGSDKYRTGPKCYKYSDIINRVHFSFGHFNCFYVKTWCFIVSFGLAVVLLRARIISVAEDQHSFFFCEWKSVRIFKLNCEKNRISELLCRGNFILFWLLFYFEDNLLRALALNTTGLDGVQGHALALSIGKMSYI